MDFETLHGLSDIVRRQAHERGSEPAFVFEGRVTSFETVDLETDRVASALLEIAPPPRRRAAILARNSDLFFSVFFGCCRAKAVLTPINTRLAPAEVAYILQDAEVGLIFVGREVRELAARAVEALERPPRLIALDFDSEGFESWADWLATAASSPPPLVVADRNDDVALLYTSGTTGRPKGVQLTAGNFVAFVSLVGQVSDFAYRPGETALCALPLFHVAGLIIALAGFARGVRTVLLREVDPESVLQVLQEEVVNHACFVPAILQLLLQAPAIERFDASALKTITYGASPISEQLLRAARARFGCAFIQFYGLTETTGSGAFLADEAHEGRLRSCGRPFPGLEVKVVDEAETEVGAGATGELLVKGPTVMRGYWKRPEATAEAIRDGWFHTGDAAYRDAKGYIFIFDRMKDMIVSGGENIYPAEVENAIFGHPDVLDVAVIGVPDERWGEAVKAMVVLKAGVAPDEDGVIAWARQRIAAFKAPRSVDFVSSIPRNPSGKILRKDLRSRFWAGRRRFVG